MQVPAAESRILLTLDKGIANLLQYPSREHGGVVLFRPDSSGRSAVLEFMRAFLPRLLEMELQKESDGGRPVAHPESVIPPQPRHPEAQES